MTLEKPSPCKVNFILNILGRRADGFHELETVMHPVPVFDQVSVQRAGARIQLSCSHPELPTDARNLVFRAAASFREAVGVSDGIKLHLEKRIPLAAGLGGGSGNAATTLLALNELFGRPLNEAQLFQIAASLGSDIPFFLQSQPALATGRGELVTSLQSFPTLKGAAIFLVHPGFGIATAWAYRELARFPAALNGRPGRARRLIEAMRGEDLHAAGREFYNSLEAPALEKFPILVMYQAFLREQGADVALMSGSGSTTFALFPSLAKAEAAVEPFRSRFGRSSWIATVALS